MQVYIYNIYQNVTPGGRSNLYDLYISNGRGVSRRKFAIQRGYIPQQKGVII